MSAEATLATDPNAAPALDAPAVSSSPQPAAPPPNQVPRESWVQSWVKPDGSLDHSAFTKAPEDFQRASKSLGRYKTVEDLVKGTLNLEQALGKKGIVDPLPENATDQERTERAALVRKINGAPDKPEGYGLGRPEGIPETAWDQKYADSVAAIAHAEGISPAALKKLAANEAQYTQTQLDANKAQEKAWFDGQDKLIRDALAKDGLDFARGADLVARAGAKWGVGKDNPLLKNATVFMLLTRLAKADREDSLITGELTDMGLQPNMSPADAQKQANDIATNKANPMNAAFLNRDHKDHPEAVRQWQTLMKVIAASKPPRAR